MPGLQVEVPVGSRQSISQNCVIPGMSATCTDIRRITPLLHQRYASTKRVELMLISPGALVAQAGQRHPC